MKLQKFKEEKKNQKIIIIFTIACVILITGVFLYKTFAIFQTNLNEDIINGEVQDIGDLEFAFYIDDGKEDKISKTAPKKDDGYSLDTSSSYCKDMATGEKVSRVNWDNENWEVRIKNISNTKTKCYLHFKKIYEEDILNGAVPDLMNGRLVPVVISEDEKPSDITYSNPDNKVGGKVTKADITDTSNPWYSYKDKKWANAVILRDGKTDTYQPGEEISESEIESYFVWIPRYRYVLQEDESTFDGYTTVTVKNNQDNVTSFYDSIGGNKGETEVFEITFETKNGTNNVAKNSIVHPAFTSFDSNGFWVGKFETGYNQNEDISSVMPATSSGWSVQGAEHNTQESTKVIIKPSVYSWRGIQVANAFYTSYNYKRELESHMMKNTEWGAVAYLTQSQYGRCNSGTCEEVRINNNSNFITGYSAKNEPTVGYGAYRDYEYTTLSQDGTKGFQYYNSNSVESSTTGNYSGVYDMSGGTWEVVMGVMQGGVDNKSPASGIDSTSNSGFKGPYSFCKENEVPYGNTCGENLENKDGYDWPSRKYYELYDYGTTDTAYQRGILGDATKEMGPFYSVSYNGGNTTRNVGSYNADFAKFVASDGSWFTRGGLHDVGSAAGIFSFSSTNGYGFATNSFRIVLTP